MFARVYDAMWRCTGGQFGPRQVDKLDVWEIAVLLGVGDETRPAESTTGDDATMFEDPHAYHKARLAHVRGEGPKPEARPIDMSALHQVTGALS